MARHFGVHGHVVIERNPDGGRYENHWLGRFEFYNPAPSRHAEAVIGLAGAVAEWLDFEWEVTPRMVFDDLVERPEHLSATDRAKVGRVTLPKVTASLHLVRRLWPVIEADANQRAAVEERVALEVVAAAPTPPKKSRPKAA